MSAAFLLLLLGSLTVWQVDINIRSTMLPAAPPVAELTQQSLHRYRLSLLGREVEFSLEGAVRGMEELDSLLRTPPAPLRLYYQLRAFATGELPRNSRADPRKALEG